MSEVMVFRSKAGVVRPGVRSTRPYGFVPSDVPQAEADALIWLYEHGGGDGWTNKTGWTTDPVVNNWYGVTVVGGHVTRLEIGNNNGSGDIGSWPVSDLPQLYLLYLNTNSFSGDLSGWDMSNIQYLQLYNNLFSGDLSGWDIGSLLLVRLQNNSFSGDLSGWILPAGLLICYINDNSFSGDLSGWILPAGLYLFCIHINSFSGVPDISANTAMRLYYYFSNALVQADVDGVCQSIYNRRAAFTYATPQLRIGGTNAVPSGAYVDEDPPVTGQGYIFELCNDPEAEGFNTWQITYRANGGDVTKP